MTGGPSGRPHGGWIDAGTVRAWCRRSTAALEVSRTRIDALNVFPVPDGDTGSNLVATIRAAARAVDAVDRDDVMAALDAAAAGALEGARGSSGAILATYLRGFAAGLLASAHADGRALRAALSTAADAAYAAVSDPVEGTMLTVGRAAAAAAAAAGGDHLVAVAVAAADGARAELALTPTRLPVLAAARVVDAGGQGLVVALEALVDVLAGVTSEPTPAIGPAADRLLDVPAGRFGYEVQFLLDAAADSLPALRRRLEQLGDEVVVVAGTTRHHVHVHADDVGAAIEAGIEAGRPHRIRVTRFADGSRPCGAADTPPEAGQARVLALCPGGTLADLYGRAGVTVVELDDEASAPAGVDAALAGRDHVIVLPNARELRAPADEAAARARSDGRVIAVVPSRSPMQGLAAVAVHDPTTRIDDAALVMSAAAAATRYATVTTAEYDALTTAGPCHAGDVLGLIDDDVATIGADVADVARVLLDRLLAGGGELVTIVTGVDAPDGLGSTLVEHLRVTRPAVEAVVYDGGRRSPPLLLGVE